MGIELKQGANTAILDQNIAIAIGWNADASLEADASAFLVNAAGKVRNDQDFIFYNQTQTSCGGLLLDTTPTHAQRSFRVALERIPEDVIKLVFTVTIATAPNAEGCPHCGMMGNISIWALNQEEVELMRFDLKTMGKERALILGELYRYQGAWKFRAVGQGYNNGLDALATSFGVNIQNAANSSKKENAVELANRLPSKRDWTKRAVKLQQELQKFLPQINAAVANNANESNTRMILDRILLDVFGYSMEEVKAEQKIQGRKADYVLAVDEEDVIVGESKRAGLKLSEKHVFQATSYGAYSGIRWALLTNLSTWQIYHISMQNIVDANLVFSVNLLPEISLEDCEKLVLISRFGMTQKGALEKCWREVNALTRENLIQAILTEDVVKAIRIAIRRDTGCNFDNDLIQQTLLDVLIHP